MLHVDYRAAKLLMDLRLEEALDEARAGYLRRQTGVQPSSWLSRTGHQFLGRLGRLLVATGRRLEEYGPALYQVGHPAKGRPQLRQTNERGVSRHADQNLGCLHCDSPIPVDDLQLIVCRDPGAHLSRTLPDDALSVEVDLTHVVCLPMQ